MVAESKADVDVEAQEVDTQTGSEGKAKSDQEDVDFETAIALTGYGKFNYLLNFVAVPAAASTVFDTTIMSYILPSAECDLNLTSLDKGALNAVVYAGMISSALVWGFLSDTLGRRKLLLVGYFLLSTLMVISSFSQVFWLLAVFKFAGGFVACGPFAVLLAYLAEFNSSHQRARAMMMVGIFTSIAIICVPALAWLLIPQPWSFTFFGGYITYNSWRIFIAVSALPSFVAGCGICFFDESPKFLMSCGRREAALEVFRRVYSVNSGNPPESYPVKSLREEKSIATSGEAADSPSIGFLTLLKLGAEQMKPFFHKPYIFKAFLVFTIQFGGLWGLNTIRLWLPQLFAIVEEFSIVREDVYGNATLCEMLAARTGPKVVTNESIILADELCVPVQIGDTMYIYSMIVGLTTAIFNLSASSIINCVGKKKILVIGYSLNMACVIAMYWCSSMEMLLAVASLSVGSGSMSSNALMSVVVDLFPTSLRTMAVSITMMIGRVGALTGNITFPVFLEVGCATPFFLIGAILLVCSSLTFLLPRTTGKALE